MSDAKKQSVERCKYRHQWEKVWQYHDGNTYTICDTESLARDFQHKQNGGEVFELYRCTKCEHIATAKESKQAEAFVFLRKMLKPGDTIYTILKHVSRSGMTRGIECYALTVEGGPCVAGHNYGTYAKPLWITSYVGHAIDSPQPLEYWRKSMGLKVNGCGMDMGFHVVNSLSYALYGDGYAIKHEWL